jgi:hypothetical protein
MLGCAFLYSVSDFSLSGDGCLISSNLRGSLLDICTGNLSHFSRDLFYNNTDRVRWDGLIVFDGTTAFSDCSFVGNEGVLFVRRYGRATLLRCVLDAEAVWPGVTVVLPRSQERADGNAFWFAPVMITVGVVIGLLFAMRGNVRKQATDDPLERQPFIAGTLPAIIA